MYLATRYVLDSSLRDTTDDRYAKMCFLASLIIDGEAWMTTHLDSRYISLTIICDQWTVLELTLSLLIVCLRTDYQETFRRRLTSTYLSATGLSWRDLGEHPAWEPANSRLFITGAWIQKTHQSYLHKINYIQNSDLSYLLGLSARI